MADIQGFIYSSKLNIIRNNNCSNNNYHGIAFFVSSNDNIVMDNIAAGNYNGIFLSRSDNNTFNNNTISNNIRGFNILSSYGFSNFNLICSNNFINNSKNGYDDSPNNFWDNGYPSGGNYWSDYIGVDNYKGPNQNLTGSDGIGDTPYNISGGAGVRDNYPLLISGSVSIGSYAVSPGATVIVPIEIGNANNVAGGVVNITFDASVVTLVNVTAGDFGDPVANINNMSGWVKLVASSYEKAGKSEAVLANLTFKAEAIGESDISFVYASLNNEAGNLIIPKTTDGMIEVS